MPVKWLIPKEKYQIAGVHIGVKQKTKDMREFTFKVREDGLALLNLKKVDDRIRIAAKFLAQCNNILVATRKVIAFEITKKFAEIIGCNVMAGRFIPGILTNPNYKKYSEVDAMLIVDPMIDYQAIKEAIKARVPVVALCDTFNETREIDLIIPANNKGKKALATVFWVLAKEILKEKGKIKSDKEFIYKIEDFAKEE